MFRYLLILFGLGLVILMGALIIPISERDRQNYEKLKIHSRKDLRSPTIESHHTRKGVSKQIWKRGEESQIFILNSAESELTISQKSDKMSMQEALETVTCVIQEKVSTSEEPDKGKPKQKIRYLEARCATYDYATQNFVANGVELWDFILDGHTPPETFQKDKATLHGKADQVIFALDGKTLFLNGHVCIQNDMGTIFSDSAQILCHGLKKASQITLRDNVKLINEGTADRPIQQYALADRVRIFPEDQKMVLSGIENRVLFYDQLQDMQLSAAEVRAEKDPETRKERIRGIGNVRFVFGQEEMERIKRSIGK